MADIIEIGDARERRATPPVPAPLEPLWRDALGARLRMLRLQQGEKLADTASRAGISPQYLSEIERGRKDPSSEMTAAVAGALGTSLVDLARGVADDLRDQGSASRGVMLLAA